MDILALLDKTDHLVGQFEEHLRLALQITDDPKLQVFLGHLLDEEQEHRQHIQTLKAELQAPSSSSALNGAEHLPSSTEGHYLRRDQNVLTIGSLLGQRQ
jgi:hypothetical protein